MIAVQLTWSEVKMAVTVGVTRNIASLMNGQMHKQNCFPKDGWSNHIEGACGEMAVAKHYGVYYDGHVNEFKRPGGDVDRWEIRTCPGHGYSLFLYRDDDPNKRYLLVTGVAPNYCIRGWITGRDGMRSEWLEEKVRGRGKSYYVPQSALTEFE